MIILIAKNETKIPDHTNFKNKLNNNKNISNEEYKHAYILEFNMINGKMIKLRKNSKTN